MPQESATNQNSNNLSEELKILITGDKPKNLLAGNPQANALAYSKQMAGALEEVSERVLRQTVEDNPGKKIVLLSGLELGVEQAAVARAVELGIEVRAHLPHKDHGKNWTSDNQKQYQDLIRKINETGGTVERSDKEYSPQRTQLRDYRMVDEAKVVVSLHDPSETPAHQKTLDYAAKHSKTVLNVWTEAEKTLGEVSKNFDDKKAQNQTATIIPTGKQTKAETRLLDLNNIQTDELKLLSPTSAEVDALEINRSEALAAYAERLRGDYKENKNGLRDALKTVSDALDKGERITIACNCRNGEMCHADVVKMAIEKINLHVKNRQIQETSRNENAAQSVEHSVNTDTQKQGNKMNPRTQRAVVEILATSETDKLLEKINQTDGRNQSEQASHLGKFSQFVRDVYERGGNVVDGNLIVPKETLTLSPPLAFTTQNYAVKRLGGILKDESKAKEIAPTVIEHGNLIAGATADGETKLKVFTWMYDALEGKSEFLKSEASAQTAENREQRFEDALAEISRLADEMHRLEPTDKIEFAPLNDFEQSESVWEHADESRITEGIYENAIERDIESEANEREEGLENERSLEQDAGGNIATEGFERIDLGGSAAPRLPADLTEFETARLLAETLPEIDRQLESGIAVKEILKPFHENVRQSARIDALNRLEAIYQKQKISELETKLSDASLSAAQKEKLESELSRWQSLVLTPSWDAQREILAGVRENEFKGEKTIAQASGKASDLSQSVKKQISEIDVRRQNVIELRSPSEFFAAQESAEKTFYQKTKTEDANLRLKLEEVRADKNSSEDKAKEIELKKQLNDLHDLKPSFAFKLENSSETIVGRPSTNAIEERTFVYAYVNFQLKQPETRLRHENERYRIYAARLENAATRSDVIKVASDIRAENAALGLKWKNLEAGEKEKLTKPLTNREMQFLFTETSPAHYTPEMTVARLAYAHSGESRRQLTEALLKGEIKPSPEAKKLIDSLESRLMRRELKDSMLATKHFFESLKTPNENLKYKNAFCHQEIYRLLPPQERDFVYLKATHQKENLEYRLAFRQQDLIKNESISREHHQKLEQSKAEKSFHLLSAFSQARILGERIETSPLVSKEISERDFRAANIILQNQPPEKISNLGFELKQSGAVEDRKIGEIFETFAQAEVRKSGDKTIVEIKLPENSLLETETYKELLEKFHPDDKSENDKFKLSSFHEKTLEDARIKGQDEAIRDRQAKLGDNFYASDAPAVRVFQTERALAEDLSKVVQLQQAARAARTENTRILEKYVSRAALKLENQKLTTPSVAVQKQIVKIALEMSGKNANITTVNSANRQFFAAAQTEITISDFQKYSANEKIIAENQTTIRKTFSEITVKENILEESRVKPAEIRAEDKLAEIYFNTQKAEENLLLTAAARTAFDKEAKENLEGKSIGELVAETERREIKYESANKARIALEPAYKNFEEKDYNEQALKLADAIEKAHDLSKQDALPSEIAEAFEVAENERTVLSQTGKTAEKSEDKPLSLRLYEAEMNRAEKELWRKNLSAKVLAGVDYSETGLTLNLDKIFSVNEREQMKLQAAEIAKTRLEPKELDADHRKLSSEAGRQALATFRQLEQAHNVFQFSNDKLKITEAFSKLDREAATLSKFRQDYNRTEKLALLRDGVKSDLVDLLRKNQDLKGDELTTRTGEILRQNFAKTGLSAFVQNDKQAEILSREISGTIEAKRKSIGKDKTPFAISESKEIKISSKIYEAAAETLKPKYEQAKESFVRSR